MRLVPLALVAILPCTRATASAQVSLPPGVTTTPLPFPPGRDTVTARGTIAGDRTIDYLVPLRAGRPLRVRLASPSGSLHFNILEPGERVVAVHNGSVQGNRYDGRSVRDGDYRIRVYLVRAAARRGTTAAYRLEVIARSGDAAPGAGRSATLP